MRPVACRHTAAIIALAWVAAVGCDPGGGDFREWTAADHDRDEQRVVSPPSAHPGGMGSSGDGVRLRVEASWHNRCARCHGQSGRGDGPQGATSGAPDLSRAEWQAAVTDDAIAGVIRAGRGKMPAHELPGELIQALVARIRALNPIVDGGPAVADAAGSPPQGGVSPRPAVPTAAPPSATGARLAP